MVQQICTYKDFGGADMEGEFLMTVFVHETAVVDEGVSIGDGTKVWHFSHIQSGAVIGKNCSLGQNTNVANNVHIGCGCKLQNNVSVYEGVELADWVFCGPSCVFTNDLTPRAKYPKMSENYVRTYVGEGASIGANATIVCGNEIGSWALIGSGALVTSDVPSHALMLGVPARQHGWVCECGKVLPESLECAVCGRLYKKTDDAIEEIDKLQYSSKTLML